MFSIVLLSGSIPVTNPGPGPGQNSIPANPGPGQNLPIPVPAKSKFLSRSTTGEVTSNSYI